MRARLARIVRHNYIGSVRASDFFEIVWHHWWAVHIRVIVPFGGNIFFIICDTTIDLVQIRLSDFYAEDGQKWKKIGLFSRHCSLVWGAQIPRVVPFGRFFLHSNLLGKKMCFSFMEKQGFSHCFSDPAQIGERYRVIHLRKHPKCCPWSAIWMPAYNVCTVWCVHY